ncbi:MAG: ABC transporter substrate-binding protein [Myxococcales bacterium]|nr:ABC transporter substrate-binding protein [Myxococcales bacterium]
MGEPLPRLFRGVHRRLDGLNVLGLLLASGVAAFAGLAFAPGAAPPAEAPATEGLLPMPDTSCPTPPCRGLRDASGTLISAQPYERIVSGNIVADRLLLELLEPGRIAAFSPYASQLPEAHRYANHPHLAALEDLEGLLALHPDLFIVNGMASRGHVERLRRAGVAVFDLGPMEGLTTLRSNVNTLAQLLAVPARGAALQARIDNRVATLGQVERRHRLGALYVGIHGGKMYGGTVGSSLHDVLSLAGLEDRAAIAFAGWPAYTHEDLLALDPHVVVTQAGMRATLCHHPGLAGLGACMHPDRFIELPAPLLTDPGLSVLDAAEALAAALASRPALQGDALSPP